MNPKFKVGNLVICGNSNDKKSKVTKLEIGRVEEIRVGEIMTHAGNQVCVRYRLCGNDVFYPETCLEDFSTFKKFLIKKYGKELK